MSNDETKDGHGPTVDVKVVRIPLSDLVSGKVNLADALGMASGAPSPGKALSPLERHAAALASIQILGELSESNQRHLENALAGAWKCVEHKVLGRPTLGWDIQTVVLSEYFQHSGDWRVMKDCLRRKGSMIEETPGQFLAAYERHLALARAEYARSYGNDAS